MSRYGLIELHDNYDFGTPIAPREVVMCKDCRFKTIYDDGETHYYYCALEDRPNRQWSIDETDYCSWAEREGE